MTSPSPPETPPTEDVDHTLAELCPGRPASAASLTAAAARVVAYTNQLDRFLRLGGCAIAQLRAQGMSWQQINLAIARAQRDAGEEETGISARTASRWAQIYQEHRLSPKSGGRATSGQEV